MIRITQVKMKPDSSPSELEAEVRKLLHVKKKDRISVEIVRQSVDARRKPDIFYVYTVDVAAENEPRILSSPAVRKNRNISSHTPVTYHFPAAENPVSGRQPGDKTQHPESENHAGENRGTAGSDRDHPGCGRKAGGMFRPVIVGSGPAGMFCALMLARSGLDPIVLERGEDVDHRSRTVENFWNGGRLNPDSNVQFGEGGAGTFSDGKLNTMIRDPDGRIRFVLKTFAEHGADPSILYSYKPHVGTDVLKKVVRSIRSEIESAGGEYRFGATLRTIERNGDGTWHLLISGADGSASSLDTDTVVLAIGHSARDTFGMLCEHQFIMTPKAFAVGLRVQHRQKMIDGSLYGRCSCHLPPSSYRVTSQSSRGHGVYSFCMCPGGYVVNASSEEGRLAVNGMSYSGRGAENANSAIVVTVSPEEYRAYTEGSACEDPLSGVRFQRMLEERAFRLADGKIPLQRFEDFCENRESVECGEVTPCIRGLWAFSNVRRILPEPMNRDIEEGMRQFDRKIRGFASGDALLCGVESRTSSPVRIEREPDTLEARNRPGIYPCGEGAGYAGGITSAAVDGIRVAEKIVRRCDTRGVYQELPEYIK